MKKTIACLAIILAVGVGTTFYLVQQINESVPSVSSTSNLAAASGSGTQNAILVILVDDTTEPPHGCTAPGALCPGASLANTITSDVSQINPYYAENYYGNWTNLPMTVTDWLNVPYTSGTTDTAYATQIANDVTATIKSEGGISTQYNVASYKYVFIVTSQIIPAFPVTGNGTITGKAYTSNTWVISADDGSLDGFRDNSIMMINGIVYTGTYANGTHVPAAGNGSTILHEFGHALGLVHSGAYADQYSNISSNIANFSIANYGPLTVMGNTGNPPTDLNVIQKEDLGIIQPSAITTTSGPGTYTLKPIETNPSALELVTPTFPLGIFIEYRTPTGFDAGSIYAADLTTVWQKTTPALSNSTDDNLYIDACSSLSDGTACNDTYDNLAIQQISHTATQDTVRIAPIIYLETTNSVSGAGIPGATIEVSGGDIPNDTVGDFVTNANAATSTSVFTVGQTYNALVTAPGYAPLNTTFTITGPGQVITFPLLPPITFEITDSTKAAGANGIVGAYIHITGGNLPYATNIATNANAAATTTTLTVGQTYNVTVTKPGYTTLTTTAGIHTAGQVVKWSLTPITMSFETPNAANAAAGVVGATITIKNTPGDPVTIPAPIILTTNSNAFASYAPFPLGIYTITASKSGFQTLTQGPDYITKGQIISLPMTPVSRNSGINLNIPSLPNGAEIEIDSPSDPELPPSDPLVCEIESVGAVCSGDGYDADYTDSLSGLGLLPGDTYTVDVSDTGYNTESGTVTTTSGTATLNLPALTPSSDIVYGTSEDVNGNPLTTSGQTDAHWTTSGGNAITYDNESYTNDSNVLNGIGPTDAALNSIGFPEAGEYSYTTTFNLTQSEISSMNLQFVVSPNCNESANCIADVVLNGYSSAGEIWVPSGSGYKFIFGPSAKFVVGQNTLTIDVQYNEENDSGYYDQNDAPSAMTSVKFSGCSGIVCR